MTTPAPINLLGLDSEALVEYCASMGEQRFRAFQLARWVHQRGVADFGQMHDLAQSLREKLTQQASVTAMPLLRESCASDGTIKWLFDAGGGNAIETVYIPEEDRATLCLSSQAGCAVGCTFCATGAQGFGRNLTTAEIVGQLWYAEHSLRQRRAAGHAERGSLRLPRWPAPRYGAGQQQTRIISNVVMMGMGEPLQNYAQVLPALRLMLADHAYGLSRRRITVSTCGVVPMMQRLAHALPVSLAVSLHAPTDAIRNSIVPLNRKYPLAELMQACCAYLAHAPRDFITLEYCMLAGINDQAEHAQALLALLAQYPSLRVKLNLIPFNPIATVDKRPSYHSSTAGDMARFAQIMQSAGVITTVRKTRGGDIAAACGQLAGEVQDRTRIVLRRARQERAAAPCAVVAPA